VREALQRLVREHPFLVSARYATDCAEVRYWEEADSCGDACALALRLWGEHRRTAELPPWDVVGLEALERGIGDRRSTMRNLSAIPVTPLMPATIATGWRSTV
jgi:hypothetical protein